MASLSATSPAVFLRSRRLPMPATLLPLTPTETEEQVR
jgi:hypothetical protein